MCCSTRRFERMFFNRVRSTLISKPHKIDFTFLPEENMPQPPLLNYIYSNTERAAMLFTCGWYGDNSEVVGLITHKDTSCMEVLRMWLWPRCFGHAVLNATPEVHEPWWWAWQEYEAGAPALELAREWLLLGQSCRNTAPPPRALKHAGSAVRASGPRSQTQAQCTEGSGCTQAHTRQYIT